LLNLVELRGTHIYNFDYSSGSPGNAEVLEGRPK